MKNNIRLIGILLGLLSVSAACKVADHGAAASGIIEQDKDQIVQVLRDLVQIKSVQDAAEEGAPSGKGVSLALDKMLSEAKRLGFKTVNMDGYAGYAEYGTGDDYIAILTHLDVVEAGEGWTYPPFAAEIREGEIYGRGAVDDKGPAVASLFALKAVRDAGVPLTKKVRLIFGTTEENSVADIHYYLKREKPPAAGFTPDGNYPVINAEKGRLTFNLVKDVSGTAETGPQIVKLHGGIALNSVPANARAEILANDPDRLIRDCNEYKTKHRYDLETNQNNNIVTIISTGRAAHAAIPENGQNAVMRLLIAIDGLRLAPSSLTDTIHFLANKVGEEVYGESLGLAVSDEPSGPLTFVIAKIDLQDGVLTVGCDMRYPVTCTKESVLERLAAALEGTGLEIEIIADEKPLYFPADSPLVQKLLSIYRDQTGKDDQPFGTGGASYARDLPNILVFGPVFPNEVYPGHMPDEYYSVDRLIMDTKIFANAIIELAK